MAIMTFVMWGIVALMVVFIVLYAIGSTKHEINKEKANAYLAKKYDEENAGR
jgi:hypothetical protein